MEKHYIYILESCMDGTFYKGYTTDYLKRIQQHNEGSSKYTSNKGPWFFKYVEVHDSKTVALQRELMLKKQNRKYLLWLFEQPTNLLRK